MTPVSYFMLFYCIRVYSSLTIYKNIDSKNRILLHTFVCSEQAIERIQ